MFARTTPKVGLMLLFIFILGVSQSAFAQSDASRVTTNKDTFASDKVGPGGPQGSADYYAQGNDDNFAVFSIASFQFSKVDFGLPGSQQITNINSAEYTLAHNDRSFTSGGTSGTFEVFLTTESFASDYSSLSFDMAQVNGLGSSGFSSAPVSVGVFPYAPKIGPETDTFTLDLSGVEADVIAALNAGEEFSLILAVTSADAAITFSGLGNTFDPGDPNLALDVDAAAPSQSATKTLTTSNSIHQGGPGNNADYYGQGNANVAFAEYGIASFQFSKVDFGLGGGDDITSINSASYVLTHNDRSFSTGGTSGMLEFFLTTDAFASDFSSLSYDGSFVNGINGTQYTNAPVSLGQFAYTPQDGGVEDTFALDFSGVEADVIAALNGGAEFNIIIAGVSPDTAATYSGFGNTFDPGDPELTLNVSSTAGADNTPPTVVSVAPPDDSTGVFIGANLSITFDELVQKGTGDIEIFKSADNTAFETIDAAGAQVSADTATITIDPAGTFEPGTSYYVNFAAGSVEDTSGNDFAGISDTTTWNFTTAVAPIANTGPFSVSENAPAGTVVGDLNPEITGKDGSGVQYAFVAGSGAASMMGNQTDYAITPLWTVGDTTDNDNRSPNYSPLGILDGLGALELDANTVRVFANHELANALGYPYTTASGASLVGARITYFDIDKTTRHVIDSGLAFDTVINAAGDEITEANKDTIGGGLSRFCSGGMVMSGTYGFVDDIYMTGEEDSSANGGLGGYVQVMDVAEKTVYALGALPHGGWENVAPIETGDDNTVALLMGDDREGAPLYLWVGNKGLDADGNAATDFLSRNGLANGTNYYWKADNGDTSPQDWSGTGTSRVGSWVVLNDKSSIVAQDAEVANGGGFTFSRPEDVATDPSNGLRAVFASTGRGSLFPADDWGTTYIVDMTFTANRAPGAATLTIVYDGDDTDKQDAGIRSPDNLDWADDGMIYVQEDRSNAGFGETFGRDASIWKLNPADGSAERIAEMNRTAVLPLGSSDSGAGNLGNWESSGILDVSSLFGEAGGTIFLVNVQAHGIRDGLIADKSLVEGGQLVLLEKGGQADAFDINRSTGVITVNNPDAIDLDLQAQHILRVQAFDGVNTEFADVVINVNDDPAAADDGEVRIATYNASLNRGTAGALISDLSTPNNTQAANVAEIIQINNPDVILINEFDYDANNTAAELFRDNYLEVAQNGQAPVYYGYVYSAPSNTGIPSGFDLDNNGSVGGGNDAYGFGDFPGQYGMVIYSKYPIDMDNVRTFQKFLWKDMPNAMLPADPNDADGNGDTDNWFTPAELDIMRLSSKSHWDVPVQILGNTIHVLASHPTPPVFDGDEDRNGTRNHDEIRFWADYVAGESYIYDDNGGTGGLADGASFVLLGDMNSDPNDGDSVPGAANQLTDNAAFNHSIIPSSAGGPEDSAADGGINDSHISNPAYDTSDFGDPPGNLRVDYALPSADLNLVNAAVFWPVVADPLSALVTASDHRMVYVDLESAAVVLTLLHNNDGESALLPSTNSAGGSDVIVGGVDAFKSVTEREIADAGASGNALIDVYAGDSFLASATLALSLPPENGPVYDAIAQRQIPYTAHVFGNHEFDYSPTFLERYLRAFDSGSGLDQPFLSANLDFSAQAGYADLIDADGLITDAAADNRPIARSMIYTDPATGAVFGIVGATTFELENISSPGDVTVTANLADTAAAVQAEIDRLDGMGVNKIILVSHMQAINTDKDMIALLSGVDIAVGGGGDEILVNNAISNTVPISDQLLPGEDVPVGDYPTQVMDADGETVYLVTAKGNYKYVGRLDIAFDGDGNATVVSETSYPRRVIPDTNDPSVLAALGVNDAVTPDAGLGTSVIAPVQAGVDDFANDIIANLEVTLIAARTTVRAKESNLGNLVADAFIWTYRAFDSNISNPVVAVQNGGGIRQNAGDEINDPLTRQDTLNILPFSNQVAVLRDVTPDDFKAIMERSVADELPDGGFLQIGGFRVTYDLARPVNSRVLSIIVDDQVRGTTPIVVDGAVVAGAPNVDVVANSFTAGGGDGYDVLESYTEEILPFTYEGAMIKYLQEDTASFPVQDLGNGAEPTVTDDDPRYQIGGNRRITFVAPVTLSLLHNNDGESALLTTDNSVGSDTIAVGGVAAFKTVFEREIADAAGNAVLNVYAGDSFLASSVLACSLPPANGPVYDAIAQRQIPYTAHVFGNHEFDYSPSFLERYLRAFDSGSGLDQPFLSANLDFAGETSFADLIDADGLIDGSVMDNRPIARAMIYTDPATGAVFGIVGVTTFELENISSPGNVTVTDTLADTAAAAQMEIDRLEGLGVNKIILVSHMQAVNTDKDMIALLRGVDIAVGGGGDEILVNNNSSVPVADQLLPGEDTPVGDYPTPVSDADGETVYLVTAKGNYKYVGRLDVNFDTDGNIISIDNDESYPRRVIPDTNDPGVLAGLGVTDAVTPDAGLITSVVEPVETCLADFSNEIIANLEVTLDAARTSVRAKESNLGNLITDAFIWTYNAHDSNISNPVVAVQNGGGIRQNAGDEITNPLTREDTLNILPFSNQVAVLRDVTPADFKAAMEIAIGDPLPDGGFLQVGGFRVVYDIDEPIGSRVISIMLDTDVRVQTPIVANGAVVAGAPNVDIVTNSFTAGGGDGYDVFAGYAAEILPFTYEGALVKYLEEDTTSFPRLDQDNGVEPTVLATDERYQRGGNGRIILQFGPPTDVSLGDVVGNTAAPTLTLSLVLVVVASMGVMVLRRRTHQ